MEYSSANIFLTGHHLRLAMNFGAQVRNHGDQGMPSMVIRSSKTTVVKLWIKFDTWRKLEPPILSRVIGGAMSCHVRALNQITWPRVIRGAIWTVNDLWWFMMIYVGLVRFFFVALGCNSDNELMIDLRPKVACSRCSKKLLIWGFPKIGVPPNHPF